MKIFYRFCTLPFVFIILVFSTQTATAQVYEILNYLRRGITSSEQIANLHNGTLVVKLVSKENNITAIQEILDRNKISPQSRKKLEKKIKSLKKDRTKANKEIVDALSNYYNFSNYRIMYDTATALLTNGTSSGYFLNNEMEVDPNIAIDMEKPIYTLRYGLGDYAETNNFKGFIITDSDANDLKKPFPYYVKSKYPPFSSFSAFFGQTETLYPDFTKMIKILNNKLTGYHSRSLLSIQRKKLKEEMKALKEGQN